MPFVAKKDGARGEDNENYNAITTIGCYATKGHVHPQSCVFGSANCFKPGTQLRSNEA
jgi:hypothetical protein